VARVQAEDLLHDFLTPGSSTTLSYRAKLRSSFVRGMLIYFASVRPDIASITVKLPLGAGRLHVVVHPVGVA
jgi:hypothetical protein